MTSWVALLRGVNVGGVTVRGADLVPLFAGLGFTAVSTVLASGNVRFTTSDDAPGRKDNATDIRAALRARIEDALSERYEAKVSIVLVRREEVEDALRQFPFDVDDATRQPWVIFCADADTQDELVAAASALSEDVDPVAKGLGVIYWWPPKGRSTDTAFAKYLAKATFKTRTTNRNARTLARILQAPKSPSPTA